MRMKTLVRFGSVFTMLFLITSLVAATEGIAGTGWYTTAVIQNVDTVNGNISLDAYPLTGTATGGGSNSAALAAGAAVTFRPDNPGAAGTIGIPAIASAAFQGSMIVSSDVKVVSVAFVNNAPLGTLGTTGGKASGAYNGVPQGSTTLTYPGVKTGFNSRKTSFFIQAAGAAATVSFSFAANNGTTYVLNNVAIEANKTYVLLTENLKNGTTPPQTGCTGGGATSACFGALTVTSSAPVVGTVVEYPTNQTPATVDMAGNMFTAASGNTTLSCPTIKNQFPSGAAARSGIAVQNAGSTNTDITVVVKTRLPSVNTYTQNFTAVAPGKSVVASAFAGTLGGMPAGSVGAATITSSAGNVIATVSETGDPNREGLYACASTAGATTKVAVPVHKNTFPSASNAAAANTGTNIQNIGSANTDITGAFHCRDTSGTFSDITIVKSGIAPGSSAAFSPFVDSGTGAGQIPPGRLCSAVFTSSGQPIVGIANESTEGLSIPVRDSSVYEAFTLQ